MTIYPMHPVTQPGGKPDFRYTITPETGPRGRLFVARFAGYWLGQSISYASAATLAIGHACAARGCQIITEKTSKTKIP